MLYIIKNRELGIEKFAIHGIPDPNFHSWFSVFDF